MATAAIEGTMPPKPTTNVAYLPEYGAPVANNYPEFPNAGSAAPTPLAEVYIFTTKHNPVTPAEELVPLYRLSFQGSHGSNNLNLDHVYTTEQSGITTYENIGYKLDGTEGYIFSNNYAQPVGTEKLYRRYNAAKDDSAIFPASKLNAMVAAGYNQLSGNSFIGYVYTNIDADNDFLIDGFERTINTCIYDADSDDDGKSDGYELASYPRTDPLDVVSACGNTSETQHTWKDNASGILYNNYSWNYAMGYHFTPQVDGSIDQLGGYFNGTKTIKLFNKSTGVLLAQTTVSATNNWGYGSITPVTVQAGVQYTVAVYLQGSGGSYRYMANSNFFPKTYGPVTIDASTYTPTWSNSSARPTNATTAYMFGQADIRFTRVNMPGDANGDGTVQITDAIAIQNIVLNGTGIVYGSDCNEDGTMNVLDIVCAFDIVLNQ